MQYSYQLITTSAMVKARVTDSIRAFTPRTEATALKGDRHFFSALAQGGDARRSNRLDMTVKSAFGDNLKAYTVENIPVKMPCYAGECDDDYIDTKPGLYPDVLQPTTAVYTLPNMLSQLYFEVNVPKDMAPGRYEIKIDLYDRLSKCHATSATYTVEVLDALLPEQTFLSGHWFHYDCLATYYGVEVFSERHWEIIENYLAEYVDRGNITLLTPIFTPPLDTEEGGERPTVQLIDVTREGGNYTFGFEKLRRFCDTCKKFGVKELEISHLFTQWGAYHAPKVMATDEGVYRRIFGWDTDASSEEYVGFLRLLLPLLKEKLDEFGYRDHYYFHISDEPKSAHLESYAKAKNAVLDLICDHPVRDALSDFNLYLQGAVVNPVPSNNHIAPFLEAKIEDLWTYYCCSQGKRVSNSFVAMPGHRTRVMGTQMYKAGITGFLHWGYNFYFNRFSIGEVNPYLSIESNFFTPAGDCLMVYPGHDGHPVHSLHEVLFEQGLLDMRALQAAEAKVGKERVLAAINAEGDLSFDSYPKHEDYLLTLRDQINRMAAE